MLRRQARIIPPMPKPFEGSTIPRSDMRNSLPKERSLLNDDLRSNMAPSRCEHIGVPRLKVLVLRKRRDVRDHNFLLQSAEIEMGTGGPGTFIETLT
jgi:hypothetical protein